MTVDRSAIIGLRLLDRFYIRQEESLFLCVDDEDQSPKRVSLPETIR